MNTHSSVLHTLGLQAARGELEDLVSKDKRIEGIYFRVENKHV
jgi:hypothetical protein